MNEEGVGPFYQTDSIDNMQVFLENWDLSNWLTSEQEKGVSLDVKIRRQRATILTKYIRLENQTSIVSQMKDRLILP